MRFFESHTLITIASGPNSLITCLQAPQGGVGSGVGVYTATAAPTSPRRPPRRRSPSARRSCTGRRRRSRRCNPGRPGPSRRARRPPRGTGSRGRRRLAAAARAVLSSLRRAASEILGMAFRGNGASRGPAGELLSRLGEGVDREVQVLLLVGRAHLGADSRRVLGDHGEGEADRRRPPSRASAPRRPGRARRPRASPGRSGAGPGLIARPAWVRPSRKIRPCWTSSFSPELGRAR